MLHSRHVTRQTTTGSLDLSALVHRHGALLRPGRRRPRQQRGDLRLSRNRAPSPSCATWALTQDTDGTRGISAGMTVSFLAESHWAGSGRARHRRVEDRHQLAHRGFGAFKDGTCIAAAEMTVVRLKGKTPIRSTETCGQSWKSICCQGFSDLLTAPAGPLSLRLRVSRICIGNAAQGHVICICQAIREREVDAAVPRGGPSARDVFRACGKSPQCGSCACDMRERSIIAQTRPTSKPRRRTFSLPIDAPRASPRAFARGLGSARLLALADLRLQVVLLATLSTSDSSSRGNRCAPRHPPGYRRRSRG